MSKTLSRAQVGEIAYKLVLRHVRKNGILLDSRQISERVSQLDEERIGVSREQLLAFHLRVIKDLSASCIKDFADK